MAHHANGCPEYFCSRPEKWVYLYKKGLAIGVPSATRDGAKHSATGQSEESSATGHGVIAPHSDAGLYECRAQYRCWPPAALISPHLSAQDTPEAQVAAANVWAFFSVSCDSEEGRTPTWSGTQKTTCPSSSCPQRSS